MVVFLNSILIRGVMSIWLFVPVWFVIGGVSAWLVQKLMAICWNSVELERGLVTFVVVILTGIITLMSFAYINDERNILVKDIKRDGCNLTDIALVERDKYSSYYSCSYTCKKELRERKYMFKHHCY